MLHSSELELYQTSISQCENQMRLIGRPVIIDSVTLLSDLAANSFYSKSSNYCIMAFGVVMIRE